MKRWDDFLKEEPSSEFDQRLMKQVEAEMAKSSRRGFLWWLAPAALGLAGLTAVQLWRREKLSEFPSSGMLAMADVLDSEDDLILIEELEILDNLGELEEWTANG